jgi:outer membrane protein assembly factor BamD (BamD/ComL family)
MRISMIKKIILTVTALLLVFSCTTYDTTLEDNWTEEQFFKTAQQAYDQDDLDSALYFYEVYLLRYPQNYKKGIAAEYERAFILYKQKNYSQSINYFNAILEKYNSSPYAYLYPEAYKILSEKVLENVKNQEAIHALSFYLRGKAKKFGLESLLTEDEE